MADKEMIERAEDRIEQAEKFQERYWTADIHKPFLLIASSRMADFAKQAVKQRVSEIATQLGNIPMCSDTDHLQKAIQGVIEKLKADTQ